MEHTDKEIWIRTGKVIQENSVNNKGVITLEEERGKKFRKTRLVQTAYRTIEKKAPRVEVED